MVILATTVKFYSRMMSKTTTIITPTPAAT